MRFLERALERVFARHAVDPARVAVGGFSDGASHAFLLGVINGDLFAGGVLAFPPGFLAPTERRGLPSVFVAHGVRDEVLPIEATSRRLVPRLRREGYKVDYREFAGGHVVPPELAREAIQGFLIR